MILVCERFRGEGEIDRNANSVLGLGGRAAIEREAHGLVAQHEGAEARHRSGAGACVEAGIDLLDRFGAGRSRQVEGAVAQAKHADRRACQQVGHLCLYRLVGPHDERGHLLQRDLGLQHPQGVDPDATERELDQVDRDLGVLDADGFHQRQPRGVGQLEPALDGDVGEVMYAQRPGELHLTPRPSRQGIGHARSQLRRIGKHPRQYRETGDEKGNEAEQKPFPRDLARLHPVPTTRSRRWPINLDLACFSIARKTPSF